MGLLPPMPLEPLREPPFEGTDRQFPGRHHVLIVISTLLCSALLLASIVGLMDAGARAKVVLMENVPDVLSSDRRCSSNDRRQIRFLPCRPGSGGRRSPISRLLRSTRRIFGFLEPR